MNPKKAEKCQRDEQEIHVSQGTAQVFTLLLQLVVYLEHDPSSATSSQKKHNLNSITKSLRVNSKQIVCEKVSIDNPSSELRHKNIASLLFFSRLN